MTMICPLPNNSVNEITEAELLATPSPAKIDAVRALRDALAHKPNPNTDGLNFGIIDCIKEMVTRLPGSEPGVTGNKGEKQIWDGNELIPKPKPAKNKPRKTKIGKDAIHVTTVHRLVMSLIRAVESGDVFSALNITLCLAEIRSIYKERASKRKSDHSEGGRTTTVTDEEIIEAWNKTDPRHTQPIRLQEASDNIKNRIGPSATRIRLRKLKIIASK